MDGVARQGGGTRQVDVATCGGLLWRRSQASYQPILRCAPPVKPNSTQASAPIQIRLPHSDLIQHLNPISHQLMGSCRIGQFANRTTIRQTAACGGLCLFGGDEGEGRHRMRAVERWRQVHCAFGLLPQAAPHELFMSPCPVVHTPRCRCQGLVWLEHRCVAQLTASAIKTIRSNSLSLQKPVDPWIHLLHHPT